VPQSTILVIFFSKKNTQSELSSNSKQTSPDGCRQLGVTEQTYYRWRKKYGGMKTSQARQLNLLERDRSKHKQLVAELSLDKKILAEALRRDFK